MSRTEGSDVQLVGAVRSRDRLEVGAIAFRLETMIHLLLVRLRWLLLLGKHMLIVAS